jgi:hypothetical protein
MSQLLKPFHPVRSIGRFNATWLTTSFLLFCLLTGAFFSLFAPFFIAPTLIAPIALVFLVLWALPDTGRAPTFLLPPFLYAIFAALCLWPNYVAISLPALPWITVVRLVLVPYASVLLFCVASSGDLRRKVLDVWSAVPWFRNLLLAYIAIEFISIVFSKNLGQSIIAFSLEQLTFFGTFVTACYLFREEHRAERFIGFLCCIACVLAVLAVVEFRMGKVPWAGHIPSFLQINDENVKRFLAGGVRSGTHRVQTIFTTPLGYGEFNALLFPFFLHFAFSRYSNLTRSMAAIGATLILVAVTLSQARVGIVGVVISLLVYPTLIALIGWRRAPTLLTSAIVFFSPIFTSIAGVLIVTVDGIRMRIFGGGATQSSTESRGIQWELGLPKVEAHPWGYGVAQGASTVGYTPQGEDGLVSIDTNYLNVLVQYGVIGFLIYLGLLVAPPAYSFRSMLLAPREDRELQLFVPLTASFLAFLTIKSSLASQDNSALIYLLWGVLAALTWRLKRERGAE